MSLNAQSSKNSFIDLSLIFLLFSNIVTIYFAITENWDLEIIIWIYWFQSITIGIFNFIRILQLKEFSTEGFVIGGKPAQPTQETKVSTAFFFLIHYGLFHLIHLIFILRNSFTKTINYTINLLEIKYILLSALLFFLNHLFSYNYNKPRDTKKQNIGTLMFYPYARIIPMQIIIIIGGSFDAYLTLFLILKTIADVIMHIVEHDIRKGEDQLNKNVLQ